MSLTLSTQQSLALEHALVLGRIQILWHGVALDAFYLIAFFSGIGDATQD